MEWRYQVKENNESVNIRTRISTVESELCMVKVAEKGRMEWREQRVMKGPTYGPEPGTGSCATEEVTKNRAVALPHFLVTAFLAHSAPLATSSHGDRTSCPPRITVRVWSRLRYFTVAYLDEGTKGTGIHEESAPLLAVVGERPDETLAVILQAPAVGGQIIYDGLHRDGRAHKLLFGIMSNHR